MKLKYWSMLLLCIGTFSEFTRAQVPIVSPGVSAYEVRPRVRAVRLEPNETIEVDGRLDETAWERAVPASDFKQQDPRLGEPATERTEVRFVFSGKSLYMGVICYDSEPDKLIRNAKQRDASLTADDRFQWTFDPYLDGRTGYFFEVNPSGAMGDALLSINDSTPQAGNVASGGGGASRAWDGIWLARATREERGWIIEIEIPFQTLKFDPKAPAWGVNFQRSIRRKNEETLWTGWPRNQGLFRMTNAGLLEGISEVSQGIGLNLQPYFTGSAFDAPLRSPPIHRTFKGDIGGDLIYSPTPRLKASLTLNTDFAETEVDQRLVNLTRFPLFFPERRTFFLESLPLFDFANEQNSNSVRPFFSRQIGFDPIGGEPQRIDYGAKLTGRVSSNEIGFLQARTAEMVRRDQTIAPGEDFTVLRSKQNFFQQSYIGMLYTRRAERGTGRADRHTIGADFLLATSRFRGSDNLNFSAFYLRTTKPSGPNPPGSAMFGVRVEYPNDKFLLRVPFRESQSGYDPAVGFFDRRGYRRYDPEIDYTWRPKDSKLIRRVVWRTDQEYYTDLHNRIITSILETGSIVDFQSGDSVRFHAFPTYDRLEQDFKINTGPKTSVVLPKGTSYTFTRYRLQVTTANRRKVSVNTTYELGDYYSGRRRSFNLRLGLRPLPGLFVDINNEWNRLELKEGDFSTTVLRLNVNNQFGPWVSVANNVQYDSVSRILGWQSRFRWIVLPGNDIYFVYSQNWMDDPVAGLLTMDRKAATKLIYTHRF